MVRPCVCAAKIWWERDVTSSGSESTRQTVVLTTMPPLGQLYAKVASGAVLSGLEHVARGVLAGTPVPGHFLKNRGTDRSTPTTMQLPRVQIVVPAVGVDAAKHRAFCDVLQAPLRADSAGNTIAFSGYLHALAFPAAMALMTRQDFPLPTVGLVHLSNHVEHRQPVTVGERLDVTVWAQNLQAHRAGTTVEVVAELRRTPEGDGAGQGLAPVWVGRSVYLARGVQLGSEHSAHTSESMDAQRHDHPPFHAPAPTARWRLSADTGRRYAAVSGDVNPIHLSAPSARALGMKAAIAHGMYTASRALAMVHAAPPMTWEVDFAAPLVLPSMVSVAVERDGRGQDLSAAKVTVWDGVKRRPHATLTVQRLPWSS